jgi:capsular exopolysaccharide synthesis family protein
MDDTITTPDDLMDRVGIPVLGFVPDVVSRNGSLGPFAYRCQVSLVEPKSSAAEAYRNIRTSLFFSAPPEESKVIVVTSGWPGDGKTTTAANLALVIAQSGKRVLLIDADFRRPMMHKIFGLDRSVGLSTVLVGQSKVEDAVQKMTYEGKTVENLDILTVGPRPTNPAELLDSQAMRRLLEEVRKNYDRVIMDTPPVLYVADSSIVSAISDRVVLVVKSNKNAASLTIKVREHLEAVKARILGGIINDVFVARLGYYYSRYYKYYPYYRYYRNYDRACYPSKEETPEGKKESAT